jgi:hypothetical protein
MRNPTLAVAMMFVLAVPSTVLADKKKSNTSAGKQEYLRFQFGTVFTTSARQQGNGSTTGKPLNPTVNPAFQGMVCKKARSVAAPDRQSRSCRAVVDDISRCDSSLQRHFAILRVRG